MRLSAVWFDLSSNRAMVLTTAGLTLATVAFANIVYAIALRLLFVETVRLSDPMVLLLITVITAVIALPIFAGFLILFRRNLALQAHLTEAIRRDHLTRVMSREAFVGDFDALARKDPRAYPGSLLVVDVDHFKRINDTLGHETGDRALVAVAEALKSGVRPGDFVGRIGGEEFAVFLAGVATPAR
ncbi:MAG: GGDEF domain-containing protein, partial [Pseudomonadota bacterium]